MAGEAASGEKSAAENTTSKRFINPSFDVIKTIPQGVIELGLRGTGAVSACGSYVATLPADSNPFCCNA